MYEAKANNGGNGPRGGALIYVVDDEPMLLELATVILESRGYRVETFRAPDTALRAFRTAASPPALIITDFAMHRMSGLDLVEACRQIRPGQKVILVSGTVVPDVLHGAAVLPDRFLLKPYHAQQLIDMVEAVLAE
jgi:DNA-binding response OmpR family regulator